MTAGGLKPRDGTLGCSNAFCHGVLRQPRLRASLQYLTDERVLEFEPFVRFGKTFALFRLGDEVSVVVAHGLVWQIRYVALP